MICYFYRAIWRIYLETSMYQGWEQPLQSVLTTLLTTPQRFGLKRAIQEICQLFTLARMPNSPKLIPSYLEQISIIWPRDERSSISRERWSTIRNGSTVSKLLFNVKFKTVALYVYRKSSVFRNLKRLEFKNKNLEFYFLLFFTKNLFYQVEI